MKISEKPPKFSATRVDLAAPGRDISSTVPDDRYQPLSGTSMATPCVSGMGMMMYALGSGASPDQIEGALRHADAMAILSGKSEFRSEEEYVRLDARDILKQAATEGISVLEQLERRYPVQDEMPMAFSSDAKRDEYFQGRVDDRAKRVEALKALEGEPGYSGPKTDWSGEKAVQISQLEPAEKAAFYAKLDSLNQAYYGRVIAMLT
ncbi:MAG: S8 family serine peptidase [Candidatus Eremiobacteraeota bacterium]|nr:S8 family serine peptidase [Candidatus Eremiobacteraeota bacterium]MCW5869419.1 S8 family serine peptidase [Candidatus Eremiobacteraeota bacterium]